MNENAIEKNNEIEIDLQRLFAALLKKAWLVVVTSIVCAVVSMLVTIFGITPLYKSSAMFYVNNSSISVGEASLSLSSSDITASKSLVESYIVILKTRASLNDVIDYSGVNLSYEQLKGMISASAVNSTEIFEVTVTSPDPQEAEQIANAIAYILPKRISSIIEGTSAKVVDSAVVPTVRSSPSYTKNTILGFLVGLVLSVAYVVLRELFDVTIRTEEDITVSCKYPILAAVPDMAAPSKGGYYRSYGYGHKHKKQSTDTEPVLIGKEMSFAAAEAYKLLRTKLQFSFADENKSRVIGVSSALTGEGKSLTAVNMAHTLAQLGKKVLLIDCDMRRPSISAKLSVQQSPGLSNFLSGQAYVNTLVQPCGIKGEEKLFGVVAAGHTPPNPIELLSSERMSHFINNIRDVYDYVILDLPPVGEVSDAMAVAKLTDGVLLVVRQNYCNRIVLAEAVRQFEFVGTKILGVVYNCAVDNISGYGYGKRYYRRYYKRYYKRYHGYGYGAYGVYGHEAELAAQASKDAEAKKKTPSPKKKFVKTVHKNGAKPVVKATIKGEQPKNTESGK